MQIYFLFVKKMNLNSQQKKCQKNNLLSISVLKLPSKDTLISIPSQCSDYNLVHYSDKKVNLAVYKLQIPKSKLLTNLETYQWRLHTEFPIVKTKFISVKNQSSNSASMIDLEAYIEHCPLRLNLIYEITLGQALFLLKECMVGF